MSTSAPTSSSLIACGSCREGSPAWRSRKARSSSTRRRAGVPRTPGSCRIRDARSHRPKHVLDVAADRARREHDPPRRGRSSHFAHAEQRRGAIVKTGARRWSAPASSTISWKKYGEASFDKAIGFSSSMTTILRPVRSGLRNARTNARAVRTPDHPRQWEALNSTWLAYERSIPRRSPPRGCLSCSTGFGSAPRSSAAPLLGTILRDDGYFFSPARRLRGARRQHRRISTSRYFILLPQPR